MARKLVTIGYGYGTAQIGLCHAAFAAAGIPLFVADQQSVQLNAHLALALGGARLQVFEQDQEAAARLLDAIYFQEQPLLRWPLVLFLGMAFLLLLSVPIHLRGMIPIRPVSCATSVIAE